MKTNATNMESFYNGKELMSNVEQCVLNVGMRAKLVEDFKEWMSGERQKIHYVSRKGVRYIYIPDYFQVILETHPSLISLLKSILKASNLDLIKKGDWFALTWDTDIIVAS